MKITKAKAEATRQMVRDFNAKKNKSHRDYLELRRTIITIREGASDKCVNGDIKQLEKRAAKIDEIVVEKLRKLDIPKGQKKLVLKWFLIGLSYEDALIKVETDNRFWWVHQDRKKRKRDLSKHAETPSLKNNQIATNI